MKVEVSVGEAIDKLSILEIKLSRIVDEIKNLEIQKEIDVLFECQEYKIKNEFYYTLLMYVNQKIWDLTDAIKSGDFTIDDPTFSYISNQIFEFNQKRFRIKNWFNLMCDSNIKEQKSYSSSSCKIVVDNEDTFFNKLPEINYLSLEYDFITFESPIIYTIRDFLKIPTIIYEVEDQISNIVALVNLSVFSIPKSEPREIFTMKPISYIVGGMFGDFIQCLSVINEKFYETGGRRGILYLSEHGDKFRNGLENTYNDTYPVLIKQRYMQDYKIYNNEPIEINLVLWRHNIYLFNQNWYHTYKQTYNIEWGKRKWLEVAFDKRWENKVVINTTDYRGLCNLDFKLLKQMYPDDLIFISSNKEQHAIFEKTTNFSIEYYEFTSFLELTTIINSCKLFAGSLSGPLAIANALHKNRICGFANNAVENLMNSGLNEVIPNMRYEV